MKRIIAIMFLLSAVVFAAGGGGGGGGGLPTPDPCLNVVCNSPPATYCNSGTEVTYSSSGSCYGGVCSYPYTTKNCQYGCENNKCKSGPAQTQNTTPPAPPVLQRSFMCFEMSTMEERVKCRLGISDEQRLKELKVQYLPEECRALSGTERDDCIKVYDGVQKCWMFPEGDQRIGCVRTSLDFAGIEPEKQRCNMLANKSGCIASLKKNVFSIVKFRIYDLEERAEELNDRYPDLVAKFVTDLEKKKQEFNDATTIAGKKQVILDVRELWKTFVGSING